MSFANLLMFSLAMYGLYQSFLPLASAINSLCAMVRDWITGHSKKDD
jgi:hypothetical protein